jgi:aspartyl-tRNA(Asn)/glutamyl-tRNA(Gln) amidotransferase subunit C
MEIEDLRETAALAHLNLDEKELSGAFSAFEQMLGYFAAMQAADHDSQTAALPGGNTGVSVVTGPAAGISAVARTVSSDHFRHEPSTKPQSGEGSPLDNQNLTLNANNPGGSPGGQDGEEVIARMLDSAGERDGRFVVVPNVL